MIQLSINGKKTELDRPTNLVKYLESLAIDISVRHIAVAYNGDVLRRDEFDGVTLSDGDEVEIVRAVGGG